MHGDLWLRTLPEFVHSLVVEGFVSHAESHMSRLAGM